MVRTLKNAIKSELAEGKSLKMAMQEFLAALSHHATCDYRTQSSGNDVWTPAANEVVVDEAYRIDQESS